MKKATCAKGIVRHGTASDNPCCQVSDLWEHIPLYAIESAAFSRSRPVLPHLRKSPCFKLTCFTIYRDQMLFDDAGLEDCERMFEQDSEASGGLGALRASGEGEQISQLCCSIKLI